MTTSTLRVLPVRLALCRLEASAGLPPWFAFDAPLSAAVRRSDELSLVAPEDVVPDLAGAQRGWRALEVQGPLDLALTGILADIARPLADAGVPVFPLATVDTDVILVRDDRLADAVAALRAAGHAIMEA